MANSDLAGVLRQTYPAMTTPHASTHVPSELRLLFWDTDIATWDPHEYSAYAIERVLEWGDIDAVNWMRDAFTADQIVSVITRAHHLTRRSANYWALRYDIPVCDVAALNPRQPASRR